MNYLAHVLLGEHTADGFVGSLLGDFVKGPLDASRPAAVVRGIRLHRAIDRFTDDHDIHRRSRNRFVAPRRRFAGIIVDICYDHFLCAAWKDFCGYPLDEFTAEVYASLEARKGTLPTNLQGMLPRMIERDWLGSYGDLDHVGRAIDGVGTRVRGGAAMRGAIEDVRTDYGQLRADFEAFFPQLEDFSQTWKLGLHETTVSST